LGLTIVVALNFKALLFAFVVLILRGFPQKVVDNTTTEIKNLPKNQIRQSFSQKQNKSLSHHFEITDF